MTTSLETRGREIDLERCKAVLVELLQQAVDLEAEGESAPVDRSTPLIGPKAVVSSLGLVSFIADAEIMVAEEHGVEVTLVSEDALSRSRSPFSTIETLADYIAELASA